MLGIGNHRKFYIKVVELEETNTSRGPLHDIERLVGMIGDCSIRITLDV